MMYTFSTMGKDGNRYYPVEYRWKAKDCGPGVGLIDFDWTNDIEKAKLWKKRFIVEGIAMEYCDTEIIAVSGTVSKTYKVIKEQK